ncbi:MAG: sugar kinase [Bryobacteraceae bacterium]
MRILIVGDINVDLILSGYETFPHPGSEVLVDDFAMVLGSASCITGIGLRKLGNEVAFLGKAGADSNGDFCVAEMAAAGLDVSRVIRDPAVKTGVTVSISSVRDRALVSYLGATTTLCADDVPETAFDGFEHLHLSSFYLLEALRPQCADMFRKARAHGLTVSVDPAFDPKGQWTKGFRDVLAEVDVFLPNEVELEGVSGIREPLEALRSLENGRTLTVGKLGPRGAMALESGHPVSQTAPKVDAIDTTGAGDSFNSGFLHGWLHRRPLKDALLLGIACGSYSTMGLGGTAHQANLKQAHALLFAHGLIGPGQEVA